MTDAPTRVLVIERDGLVRGVIKSEYALRGDHQWSYDAANATIVVRGYGDHRAVAVFYRVLFVEEQER